MIGRRRSPFKTESRERSHLRWRWLWDKLSFLLLLESLLPGRHHIWQAATATLFITPTDNVWGLPGAELLPRGAEIKSKRMLRESKLESSSELPVRAFGDLRGRGLHAFGWWRLGQEAWSSMWSVPCFRSTLQLHLPYPVFVSVFPPFISQ